MKLQTLTVLFIIIILPITMVVSQFIKTEISTITMQSAYDSRLNNATYDAIKSFQINESNSTTENIPTEKIRDVQASVQSFYNSLASSMGVSGYTEEDLRGYIPCLVYTLYDGYYIYTGYSNDNNKKEYGLKPYVYYTEHITGSNVDVTVSYTLDSYIMVAGTVNGESVTESGYLCNTTNNINNVEELKENIDFNGRVKYNVPYKYMKIGDSSQSNKFYLLDGKWYEYSTTGKLQEVTIKQYKDLLGNTTEDDSANKYKNESNEFTNWVNNKLGSQASYLMINNNNDPDDYSSAFNEHRRKIIKESIQSNLQSTLQNYMGEYEDFRMPDLDETEWDDIINNVSLISFMQGLPLRNKYYRGYSVVTNTQSREFVNPSEIYLIDNNNGNNKYHRITCKENQSITGNVIGYRNTTFGRKSYTATGNGGITDENYYYQHNNPNKQDRDYPTACYECIVTSSSTYNTIQEAMSNNNVSDTVKRAYDTALYRERYVNYKSLNFGMSE